MTYKVTNPDTGEDRTLAGGELLEKGLEARLLNRPDSALYLYRRKA